MDSVSTATNTTDDWISDSHRGAAGERCAAKNVDRSQRQPLPSRTPLLPLAKQASTLQEPLETTIRCRRSRNESELHRNSGPDATADTAATASTELHFDHRRQPCIVSGAILDHGGAADENNFCDWRHAYHRRRRDTTYTGDGVDTFSAQADAINFASMGVTAPVTTPSGGVSTLSADIHNNPDGPGH